MDGLAVLPSIPPPAVSCIIRALPSILVPLLLIARRLYAQLGLALGQGLQAVLLV